MIDALWICLRCSSTCRSWPFTRRDSFTHIDLLSLPHSHADPPLRTRCTLCKRALFARTVWTASIAQTWVSSSLQNVLFHIRLHYISLSLCFASTYYGSFNCTLINFSVLILESMLHWISYKFHKTFTFLFAALCIGSFSWALLTLWLWLCSVSSVF